MLNPSLGRRRLSRRALALTVAGLLALALARPPPSASRRPVPLRFPASMYDPSGGVLPEAALTLEDERQNKWQATSDSTGRFEFPPVGAGKYVLEASLAGFRPLRQELELTAARDWTRAVTLQVGNVRESITVREQRSKTPRPASQTAGPRAGPRRRQHPSAHQDKGRKARLPGIDA